MIKKLNRKIKPSIKEISKITLATPQIITLDNGIRIYLINTGQQDACKIEFFFATGRPDEHKQLVAKSTLRLIKDGTPQFNSAELAEKIDFYGAALNLNAQLDASSIVLTALNKHLPNLIPVVYDIIWNPTFPEYELEVYKKNNQERLKLELLKNDVLAYRKFTELIFGINHPYGYNSYPETYNDIQRSDLQKHHSERFGSNNCTIFISGKVGNEEINLINHYFGKINKIVNPQPLNLNKIQLFEPQKIKIDNEDSIQTSIKIGMKCFNRKHPDYNGMFVLNTIIGGYFGSRLMLNLREDKGYTYNIYSSLDTMKYDGYFYISTDTSHSLVEKAKTEIFREIKILQDQLIDPIEHKMVKNYLLGNLLSMMDGPFNTMDVVKTYISEDIDLNHFDQLVEYIQNFNAEDIRTLANKYLNEDQLWEITVGGKQ